MDFDFFKRLMESIFIYIDLFIFLSLGHKEGSFTMSRRDVSVGFIAKFISEGS